MWETGYRETGNPATSGGTNQKSPKESLLSGAKGLVKAAMDKTENFEKIVTLLLTNTV